MRAWFQSNGGEMFGGCLRERMAKAAARYVLALLLPLALLVSGCSVVDFANAASHPAPPLNLVRGSHQAIMSAIPSKVHELAGESPPGVNHALVLNKGADALAVRAHLLRAARDSVDIQMYTWVNDEAGRFLWDETIEAARRGVKVRVLIDHLVLPAKDAETLARLTLAHENMDVRFFRPISRKAIPGKPTYVRSALLDFDQLNNRMHTKLFLVDGVAGMTGGRNHQNRYYDVDPKYNFKDRDIMLVGPVVDELAEVFEGFWKDPQTAHVTDFVDVRKAADGWRGNVWPGMPEPVGNRLVQQFAQRADQYDPVDMAVDGMSWFRLPPGSVEFIANAPSKVEGEPDISVNPIVLLADELRTAREVYFQTPYLVLSEPDQKLLEDIREANPEMRFHASTNSLAATDHSPVFGVALKQRGYQMRELGFRIYQFKPRPGDLRRLFPLSYALYYADPAHQPSYETLKADKRLPVEDESTPIFGMHAKTLVIDDRVAYIGTHNFDPRSDYFNTECGFIIRDAAFAKAVADDIRGDIRPENSWVVAPQEKIPLLTRISRTLGAASSELPVFDCWPTSASCYQKKEGGEVRSPYAPDFHEHYENVGNYPEVSMNWVQIQAMLLKSFGGPFRKLM